MRCINLSTSLAPWLPNGHSKTPYGAVYWFFGRVMAWMQLISRGRKLLGGLL